jgi:predicted Zn-dependent peptidase
VSSKASLDFEVQVHTLANGLTVYLSPNPEEPRIAARVMVRAGAAYDPDDATGSAHLLEHMLANKGTDRLGALDRDREQALLAQIDAAFVELHRQPDRDDLVARIDALSVEAATLAVPNELKQAYGRVGAKGLNAFTSHDRTAYVVDLPAEALGAWIELESDRFRNPVLRAYQTEVETVREEKRRGLDDAGRASREQLSELLWQGHPYGRTILGDIRHLDAPRPDLLRAWFERWYVPDNMALVLSGDLNPEQTLARIQQAFTWEGAPSEHPEVHEPPVPRGERRASVVHRGPPAVTLAWRTVRRGHPDEHALAVADMLLCNGATGLLDVIEHEQRVRRAWSQPSFRRFGGSLHMGGTPREGQDVDEVEALLLGALDTLKAGEIPVERLTAIVQAWRIGELYGVEKNAWRASKMMEAFTYGESWEQVRDRTALRTAVPMEQVVEAARRWLGEDRVVVTRQTGEPPLPHMKRRDLTSRPVARGLNSAFFDEVVQKPRPPRPRPPLREGVDYRLHDGTIHADNPYSELASARFRLERGQGHDPMLGLALSLWDHAGHGAGDLTAWERHLYGLGAAVEMRSGRWTSSLTLRGPADCIPRLMDDALERLRAPTMDPTARTRWLQDLLRRREQSKETKATLDGALRAFAAYDRQSPWLSEPTADALTALDLEQWLEKARSLLSLRADTLAVGLQTAPRWPGSDEPPDRPPRRFHEPTGHRVLLLHHAAAQAHVAVLTRDADYASHRVPLYKLYSEAMGGSAGVVFQELREARGLAYSARGSLDRGALPGDDNLVMGQVATTPEKAADAAAVLFELMRDSPVDAARFARAKSSAVQKLQAEATTFRRIPTSVLSWRLRGLDRDPRPAWIEAMRGLEHADLTAFTDRWRQRPMTVAVLGDLTRIDRAALQRLGDCVELTLGDISTR